MIRKIAGVLIIIAFFAVITAIVAQDIGLKNALLLLGGAIVCVLFFTVGIFLINRYFGIKGRNQRSI